MITTSKRHLAAVAALAACALPLAGCHPPHQKDSEVGKVDTATGFVAPSREADSETETPDSEAGREAEAAEGADTPLYRSCMGEPVRRPEVIALDCTTSADDIRHIRWDSWTAGEAEGTGTRTDSSGQSREVSVRLADPGESGEPDGGMIFHTVQVDGRPQQIG